MSNVIPIKPALPPAQGGDDGDGRDPRDPRDRSLARAQSEPSDAEGWALLDGLRRRMDDQNAQQRKTADHVGQLAESIGSMVELQRKRAARANLNSFGAYAIFTVLCGAGAYALYSSRAHELTDAAARATADRDAAVHRADEASKALAARDAADIAAAEAWDLFGKGDRAAGAAKVATLVNAPLGRVTREALAMRSSEAQTQAGEAALKAAVAAWKGGRYAEISAPLEAALRNEPPGPRAAEMHYYEGLAAGKLNELDKAIADFQAAIAGDVGEDDVRFQLAGVFDRKGQLAKARVEYDRFATAHPQSGLAVYAVRRSATLARMPAVIVMPPAGAAPTAVPAPAAVPVPAVPKPVANPNLPPGPNPPPSPSPAPNPSPTAGSASPATPSPDE